MTENNAIVPQNDAKADASSALAQAQSTDLAMLRQKAQLLVESKFLPDAIDSWQKAAVIMLRGRELNVPDWTALQHINVIHGNPTVDGQLALALVERSGLLEEYTILRSDTTTCTIRMKRRGRAAFDCTCTTDEAATLNKLSESIGWKQQPKTHLFYFTAKQICKRLFSDVLNGMVGNKTGELPIADSDEAEYVEAEYGETPLENGQTPPENPTSVSPEPPPDEPISDGVWTETDEPPQDAFDEEFPPIGVIPKDPPPTIGSLNMDSLWIRSRINPRSDFDNLIRQLQDNGELRKVVTADQALEVIRKYMATQEFTEGKVGSVEP